ncbi:NAD(P)-dependent oxidoreductase [Hydrogenophaga sp. NH-16]|uniref:NAD(P)-dependent oxidoreductase n=1 Tax=Hydrogenophaga sp. NH-16 TaxID=2184519 RepID=UPI001F4DED59|nr:NAD(P)-dependent oxidoreductase [Hydrogenophaga sp. NH-16]
MGKSHGAAGALDQQQRRRLADPPLHGFQAYKVAVEFFEDLGDARGPVFLGEVDRSSSIAPPIAREHAEALRQQQVHHIDAPVSGGVVGAEAGTLAIMAGGDAAIVESLAKVFAALGRVTHVGPSGAGQICKLANQQIVAITIGAVAEAMILVEAGGASREKFREAIRGGFAESRILDLHGGRMVNRSFAPGGPSRLQLKDLDAVAAMADLFSLDLPLTAMIRDEFRDFVADGGGDTDHSGLLLHLEKINQRMGEEKL